MDLQRVFGEFKNGSRKSKLWKQEQKESKEQDSEKKRNANKKADEKNSRKIKCETCNGTGVIEGTEDSKGKCLQCIDCLGRGFIYRKKEFPKAKFKDKEVKKRQGKIVGKKKRAAILQYFLDGYTEEEIAEKTSLSEFVVKDIIEDIKKKLTDSLNRNN